MVAQLRKAREHELRCAAGIGQYLAQQHKSKITRARTEHSGGFKQNAICVSSNSAFTF